MTTSTKLSGAALSPRPPAKGSFPLDHLSECKAFAIAYRQCLVTNQKQSTKCRKEARAYLECRMTRGLMAKEDWKKLGLADVKDGTGGDSAPKREGATEREVECDRGKRGHSNGNGAE